MSFNIRYGTADDGENHWKHRKEFLVETIRNFNPDLLGTQETLAAQRDELAAALPAFELLAAGRDDGADRGEMMALYYARDRFEKLDGGHFWLSESPEIAGSKSWDSSLPRMVTWVQLRDRRQPLARPILFLNTHFDHRGTTARLESARRIRARAARELDRSRIILTGDFNTGENSEPYRRLFDDVDGLRSPVVDTFRTAHPERKAGEGTFSNFKADQIDGPRIDWIGASRDFRVQSASIDRTERSGRTPSDHFPVTAVLAAN
ncbi:MAG: endonuclease/exonuclease/phosphatase family protein [Planctomycetes bacterium]|nr:endonuclease/exonuclease/phosphatase family protein [Planctomycetota bacterium]